MTRRFACALALLVFSTTSVTAHDLWLIPSDKIEVGKPTRLRANVGMDFPNSEVAPDTAGFKERMLVLPDGGQGELKPAGKDGNSGLLEFTPAKAGIHVVAVVTQPKLIKLEADKFNEYLITDGMPHIYRLRVKEKILDQPGRERYSKHVKALARAGEGGGGDPCQALGLELEIVTVRDPFALKSGDTLLVRVLFRGKPLPEANLGWQLPGDGDVARGYVRTDAKGEALVPIARTGLMTLRLTHMTRPKARDYEWESFWSSLTFRLPG